MWRDETRAGRTPQVILILVACAAIAGAVLSAVAAHRFSGSSAWVREYGYQGMGLAIELAFLFLTAVSAVAISLIMSDSFRMLFLDGGWRTPAYISSAVVVATGVALYMLGFAPGILARKQSVDPAARARECRLPYLLYAPFSIITWVAFVLPVLALVFVSIRSDRIQMTVVRSTFAAEGRAVLTATAEKPADAEKLVALYDLAHKDALDAIQRMVNRYLWVIGVFMIFVVVILNTRITAVFTDESQDAFKWLMWCLVAVAVGICLFGLTRYQLMRDLAINSYVALESWAQVNAQLDVLASARAALLELRNQGPITFWHATLEGGSLWLVFFSWAMQVVLARFTRRSVTKVVFPSPVARFLDAFMLSGEEQKA